MFRWDRSSDVLSIFKGFGKFFFSRSFLLLPFFFFCFYFFKVNIDQPMIGDTRVSQALSRVQIMSELGLTAILI